MTLNDLKVWAVAGALAAVPFLLLTPSKPEMSAKSAELLFGQTPAEFAARRATLRTAAKGAIVLIKGEPDPGDIERTRFRTANNIMYLTGVESPDAVLAILPEGDPSGKSEILFLIDQGAFMRQWVDPTPGPGAATEKMTGIQSVQDLRSLWTALKPSLMAASNVIIEGPLTDRTKFGYAAELAAAVKAINPALTVSGNGQRIIGQMRYKKSAGEVANLRAAIAATGEAEKNVAQAMKLGINEITLEGVCLAAFRKGGAPHEGFPCIVGSGPNSCILHHSAGERVLGANEVVVVDIGAEYNYYSADITRTFPSSGTFTKRQREIYQLVLDCQSACQKAVVPGKTSLGELQRIASEFLRKSPLRAKDGNGTEYTMDHFFVHGLGHPLGMDVHDTGGGPLDLGVVFTIEPGVYISSENIGVRIEDDYLVTATGAEKLSIAIPSTVADVEAAMKHKSAK
ncbi:MAG: aminopeptidase P N-terminal domain-containing protein [Chthonomonadales bacterium]